MYNIRTGRLCNPMPKVKVDLPNPESPIDRPVGTKDHPMVPDKGKTESLDSQDLATGTFVPFDEVVPIESINLQPTGPPTCGDE